MGHFSKNGQQENEHINNITFKEKQSFAIVTVLIQQSADTLQPTSQNYSLKKRIRLEIAFMLKRAKDQKGSSTRRQMPQRSRLLQVVFHVQQTAPR